MASTVAGAGRSKLVDVAFSVPRLLQILCPEHAAALAATSRQLRQLIQQVPMGIRLASAEDLKLLQKGSWLQQITRLHLSRNEIAIGQCMAGAMDALGATHWPALSSLQLDFMVDEEITLLFKVSMPLLSKLQLLDSDALSIAIALSWHGFDFLSQGVDFCHIVDLFRGYWPCLTNLVVGTDSWTMEQSTINMLPAPEWLQLGSRRVTLLDFLDQPRWSTLCSLSLDCTMHQSAVQLLTSGDLSGLLALTLQTCKYDTTDILYLSRGSWPLLEQLCLAHCKLTVQSMKAVTAGNWPCLRSLDIGDTDLSTSVVAELARGQWPMLTSMNLEANWDLDDDAIAELVHGNWPLLEVLMCSLSPRLTEVGLQLLVTAKWLHMTQLNVAWAGFVASPTALHAVSHGQCRRWGCLSCVLKSALQACGNVLNRYNDVAITDERPVPLAVQVLSRAKWPSLAFLDISMNGFEPYDMAPLLIVWPKLQIEV